MAEQSRDIPLAGRHGVKRLHPGTVAAVVLGVCLLTAVLVLMFTGERRERLVNERPGATYESRWLDIPVMEIKDVALSVPLEASGAQRKQLTVGVAIRFAPAEGKTWSGGLPRDVGRRLGGLKPEFRHIVIEAINSKTYAQLSSAEGLNTALQDLKRRFEERIEKCDLSGEARVHEVLWGDLFWN